METLVLATSDVTAADSTANVRTAPESLVTAAGRLGFFGPGVRCTERVETHISWVFLTPQFAYKAKKPVHFEFLDFSTVEARRVMCETEVRLNRRLAPEVYLDVVPVTREAGGRLKLAGSGPVVDWLVKMRRLPADCMLDELIRRRALKKGDCQRIAARLAAFYQRAVPLLAFAEQFRGQIEAHVRANLAELRNVRHELPADLVARVHAAQLLMLQADAELFAARVCDGRIVDGHGDLRPEHICVLPVPVVFDCLEFSAELRCVDIADELSFLAMECDLLGAAEVGQCLFGEYARLSGDAPPPRLVTFYKSYRACVRAKVAALRAAQLTGVEREAARQQAQAYLQLAGQYTEQLGQPPVLIVGGLMGTGKSTLARALAEQLGLAPHSTDAIRREQLGAESSSADYGAGNYRPELREAVYRELFRRAERDLERGLPVVLDGTFLTTALRREAADLAQRHGARPLLVRCVCPSDEAVRRIAQRAAEGNDASEARPELYARQRDEEQPLPSGVAAADVDTTNCLSGQLQAVWQHLGAVVPSR
ncbi:MAG: AAA family ATPase [Pirellulales bacterium]|nr:AAA family ATPase [Pirellulales bacterium]